MPVIVVYLSVTFASDGMSSSAKYMPFFVGRCHHGMGRPRFADGGDGLWIWRVAANIKVYPKVSGLADWRENSKWYRSLPLGAGVSLFGESV
jgi:hypothetical protein